MNTPTLQTQRLQLFGHTPEHLRTLLDGAEAYEKRFSLRLADGLRGFLMSDEVSPAYLEALRSAESADPWVHGFAVLHLADNVLIGMAGFKGPPDAAGIVEIAYGIVPTYEGQGFATEVARALIGYAVEIGKVRIIRAHTLPEVNASTKVLEKCEFVCLGEVVDPDDGPVWRWERKAHVRSSERDYSLTPEVVPEDGR